MQPATRSPQDASFSLLYDNKGLIGFVSQNCPPLDRPMALPRSPALEPALIRVPAVNAPAG